MLQLLEAFNGHEIFFATYFSGRDSELKELAPAYLTHNIGTNLWRMFFGFLWAFRIIYREKPDVIVSSGAEIAVPFFFWAKILRIKTIYIECWFQIERLTLTARILYPIADAFYVQWPQLLEVCGPKARYEGAVI